MCYIVLKCCIIFTGDGYFEICNMFKGTLPDEEVFFLQIYNMYLGRVCVCGGGFKALCFGFIASD